MESNERQSRLFTSQNFVKFLQFVTDGIVIVDKDGIIYRPALGVDAAITELLINKGKLYDSQVVDACVCLFKEKGFKLN